VLGLLKNARFIFTWAFATFLAALSVVSAFAFVAASIAMAIALIFSRIAVSHTKPLHKAEANAVAMSI
jgi:hypothetical protein